MEREKIRVDVTFDNRDDLADHFTVNVLSSHWTIRNFIPLLEKGTQKKIINM